MQSEWKKVGCRSAFKMLTGTPTGKRPSERPRRRWEDNIRMDLKEIGINTKKWVDLAQDRVQWRALLNAPPGSISHGDLVEPTGKTPLGRLRHRWEDNIRRDLKGRL